MWDHPAAAPPWEAVIATSRRQPPALRETPGHILRRCQQRASAIFAEVLAEFGLTQQQTALLIELRRNPGASVQDLADSSGTDRNTLGDVVSRLTRRGLIRTRRSKLDARTYDLQITPAGARLLNRMSDGMAEVQRRILEPLPQKDRAKFLRYARVIAGLPPGNAKR